MRAPRIEILSRPVDGRVSGDLQGGWWVDRSFCEFPGQQFVELLVDVEQAAVQQQYLRAVRVVYLVVHPQLAWLCMSDQSCFAS